MADKIDYPIHPCKVSSFFIKMYISEQEICRWNETNPSKRNYIERKKIASAGHIVKCGKLNETNNNDEVRFVAFCMQTSHLKNKPHEINCSVLCDGNILSMIDLHNEKLLERKNNEILVSPGNTQYLPRGRKSRRPAK
ncbi:hypothetical protein PV328_001037 [Microctonus aethiopoides]|uniref:Uncharacterized protein n=1 Tax=Microctonus aethiopoides TaxID=144406 RepID=A0AA39FW42_9HYME|nr:hypothetical protein PV328_001037 [Microctonus aethiopoides]